MGAVSESPRMEDPWLLGHIAGDGHTEEPEEWLTCCSTITIVDDTTEILVGLMQGKQHG